MSAIDLTVFPADRRDVHPAVIICPGGGYWRHSPDHQETVAGWLNSLGISAFLLRYSLKPERHPKPFNDLQHTIRLIRLKSDEYGIDPAKVGVIGFSAGGHLASTAATQFDTGNPDATDPLLTVSSRPDALILCFPVITFGEFTHEGTVNNLLGDDPSEDLRNSLSNQTRVTADTPPTFLWHTADDPVVPVENSLLFAAALSRHKVPFELHIFPHGPHGTGVSTENPGLYNWSKLCETWLKSQGF